MTKTRRQRPRQEQAGSTFLAGLSATTLDLLSVAFLYLVILVLFRGIVFDNGAFASGGDTEAALSYSHAGQRIEQTEGVDAIWMPYFFSGMPTFGNVAYLPHNVSYLQTVIVTVLNFLFLNGTWTWLVTFYFLAGVFMFLLMRVWKFSRPAALLAALTVMLSPFAIGLAAEGHGSKLMALSYLPMTFLLTHLLFERRDLLSFGLFAAGIGTLLLTNHMQIVYYVLMVIGLYFLWQVVTDAKENRLLIPKKLALLVGGMLLGLCISSYIYLSVYEYAQYSIRGGGTTGSTGGLTWDYATNWSMNPWELITLLIPSFFGFQEPYYWGTMPFNESTIYLGIIPILFAVLALVYRRTRTTVFFSILTGILVLVSFGKYFSLLYEALFRYLPFFNKFRAPSMILQLLPFTMGILGAAGFSYALESRDAMKNSEKASKILAGVAAGLVGILALAFLVKPSLQEALSASMFVKPGEVEQYRQQYGQQLPQVMAQLKSTRFDLLWKDYVKFVLIAAASLGILAAYLRRKINATTFTTGVLAILLIDIFIIDVKFINPKPSSTLEQSFRADETTTFLEHQPGLFRIFPLPYNSDLWMDNTFAYHGIQSIGGYSPAKLKIYQTMIDSCLFRGTESGFPLNMHIVDMLNVRYFVAGGRLPENLFPLVNVDQNRRILTFANPGGLPRAFFVDSAIFAHTDGEVFAELNSPAFSPAKTALLQDDLPTPITHPDSDSVSVSLYRSRDVRLDAFTSSPALLVVSEVYYPAGWKAYIDGQETPILRTNYVLRSVVVPAGRHEVEFRFDPPLYRIGWTISNLAWGITGICILAGLWKLPWVRRPLTRGQKEKPVRGEG